jgi:peptide-methionine (S)-S-oxide reductase
MTTQPALRRRSIFAALALAAAAPLLGLALLQPASGAAEQAVVIPAPVTDLPAAGSSAKVVFAGGCFWGVQGVFQHLKGVTSAVSGYSGGDAATAHYELIGTGLTGHAEAVEVTYDPSVISYGDLLHVYFSVAHNPTQLNYQGPDHGTQYRSAIFIETDEQKAVAGAYIAQLDAAKVYPEPIVTTLEPLKAFYAAEDYHQDFLTANPSHPYIVYHDLPKIEALKTIFADRYRDQPALVADLN